LGIFDFIFDFIFIFIFDFILVIFFCFSWLFPSCLLLAFLPDPRSLLLLSLFALPLGAVHHDSRLWKCIPAEHRVLIPDSARRITNPGDPPLEEALNDYFARRPLGSSPGIGPADCQIPSTAVVVGNTQKSKPPVTRRWAQGRLD
jgi:hypothetical protein